MRTLDSSRWTALILFASCCLWGPSAQAENIRYTKTRYPIVLAHGMCGFETLFGVFEYWYGLPSEIERGGGKVYVTAVSPLNSTAARGEQLLAQIETILAISGAEKVNLIGHSHGGLDARYVAAVRPDLIASVTSVGSPHYGASLADYLLEHVHNGGLTSDVTVFFANALGSLMSLLAGHDKPNDVVAALQAVSTEGLHQFNQTYPEGLPTDWCGEGARVVQGIHYYSWSGTGLLTTLFDLSDGPFSLAAMVYPESNDGLVGQCASHLGYVVRDDYQQNHLDEINQLFGLVSPIGSSPKAIFRSHANRLKRSGM